MIKSNIILFISIVTVILLIIYLAIKTKSQKKSYELNVRNKNQIAQNQVVGNYVKTRVNSGYRINRSFRKNNLINPILNDNIKLIETAISEKKSVSFVYQISDREELLNYNIIPQKIEGGKYLTGRIGFNQVKTFKIEIIKNLEIS